jgi:hypothetical protein
VESGPEAKPTIEALEDERRRLRELERNLAAERDRVQAAAAREIARMQEVLRDAADRAARREHELEIARRRLERKLAGGRLGRLGARRGRAIEPREDKSLDQREHALAEREASLDDRERALTEIGKQATAEAERLKELEVGLVAGRREVDQAEALDARARALAARADELTAREVELEQKVDELVDAERRSNEQLAARRAELDAREQAAAELAQQAEALSLREPPPVSEPPSQPVAVAPDLRADQERLEAKARTLEEAERRLADVRADVSTRETAVVGDEAVLARQRAELEERAAQLREVERREAALVDRSTVLDAREAELAETIAGLEQRKRELALLREQLEAERSRLAARSRRLGEAERRGPIRAASRPQAVGFSEGLRALARKRGAS